LHIHGSGDVARNTYKKHSSLSFSPPFEVLCLFVLGEKERGERKERKRGREREREREEREERERRESQWRLEVKAKIIIPALYTAPRLPVSEGWKLCF